MGGIVTKKALLQSRDSNQADITAIAANTRGIIFMGTPHYGSKYADVAACLLKIIKLVHSENSTFVDVLKVEGAVLQELDHSFHQLLTKRLTAGTAIEVRCFFETLPINNALGVVVPVHSAAPPAYELPLAVDANHVDMTKFSGPEDQTYKNVVAELRRMIKLAKERSGSTSTEAESQSTRIHHGNNDRGALANYADQRFEGNTGGSIHYGP
jgi:protein SERAC1